jgi:hypothetical protein
MHPVFGLREPQLLSEVLAGLFFRRFGALGASRVSEALPGAGVSNCKFRGFKAGAFNSRMQRMDGSIKWQDFEKGESVLPILTR